MKIEKIEHKKNKSELQQSKIYIENNGVHAYYFLFDSFQPSFHKEIEIFKKINKNNAEDYSSLCNFLILSDKNESKR